MLEKDQRRKTNVLSGSKSSREGRYKKMKINYPINVEMCIYLKIQYIYGILRDKMAGAVIQPRHVGKSLQKKQQLSCLRMSEVT
jgi:hypothetical protein